jgi:hypothetical protein
MTALKFRSLPVGVQLICTTQVGFSVLLGAVLNLLA